LGSASDRKQFCRQMAPSDSTSKAERQPRRALLKAFTVIPLVCFLAALWISHEEHSWTPTATRHKLVDGRHLAYHVQGDLSRTNIIFWGHGTVSCRLEVIPLLLYKHQVMPGRGRNESGVCLLVHGRRAWTPALTKRPGILIQGPCKAVELNEQAEVCKVILCTRCDVKL
jgi:hypothetical protein